MRGFDLFVGGLYDYLRKHGRCFQSGAMVIDVSSPRLRQWALEEVSRGRKRPFQKTHRVFMDQHLWDARRVSRSRKKIRALTPQVEIKVSAASVHACNPKKRVFLAYVFSIENETFMYLKPEDAPARSVKHVVEAGKRYILKPRLSSVSRRENSYLDRGHAPSVNAALAELDRRAFGTRLSTYDAEYRTGAEIFVPGKVAESIIHT